ncbi:MAG: hypothetical protein ABJH45_19255 [Paracoccaceae bacterium]
MSQIINMIIRIIMRKVINKGINVGINKAVGARQKRLPQDQQMLSPEEEQERQLDKK